MRRFLHTAVVVCLKCFFKQTLKGLNCKYVPCVCLCLCICMCMCVRVRLCACVCLCACHMRPVILCPRGRLLSDEVVPIPSISCVTRPLNHSLPSRLLQICSLLHKSPPPQPSQSFPQKMSWVRWWVCCQNGWGLLNNIVKK